MLQGLNMVGDVHRPAAPVLDEVGGATTPTTTIQFANVKCRISTSGSFRRVENMTGVDVTKLIRVSAWPPIDVQINDVFIPQTGVHAGKKFVVIDIQVDSLKSTSRRAHTEFTAERYDSARSRY